MKQKQWIFLLAWVVALVQAAAPRSWGQYEVEQESRVWLRGLLDVRVARGGRAPSWMDGGAGKSRYGGRSTSLGFERVTRLALS
ncbi:MAG: hypothetical protein AB7P69_29730, partial [Candidatus Binatia bacterium]